MGTRALHSASANPIHVLSVAERRGVAGGDLVLVHLRVLLPVDGGEGIVDTQLSFVLDSIESVEAPDAQTVVVKYSSADCTALNYAGALAPVPSRRRRASRSTDSRDRLT